MTTDFIITSCLIALERAEDDRDAAQVLINEACEQEALADGATFTWLLNEKTAISVRIKRLEWIVARRYHQAARHQIRRNLKAGLRITASSKKQVSYEWFVEEIEWSDGSTTVEYIHDI